MAWRRSTRYQSRFWMTVLSLFLGMQTFLCAVVIINGADYIHVIENRPDVLIAGEFSEGGQNWVTESNIAQEMPGKIEWKPKGIILNYYIPMIMMNFHPFRQN